MKKLFIAGIGIVLAVIGTAVVVGILKLGPVIKIAVNTYGPEIVKTRVGVEEVAVSVFSAQAELKRFILGNPEGFVTPQAIRAGSIFMDIDESSLIKDTIVIDRIEVDRPEITYEIKGQTDNFRTIMNNMKGPAEPEEQSEKKTAGGKKSKNLLIRDFIIKGGRVSLAVSMLKGEIITAPLPDIHLRNIGQGGKGATPREVLLQVFQEVYGKITSPDLTREFASQLKEMGIAFEGLEENTRQQIREAKDMFEDVKDGVKGVGEKFKSLFHQ